MKSRKFGTMQFGCNWMQLGFSKMNGGWDYRLCVCHPSLSQFEASPSCKASTNFRHYPRMFFCFLRKHTWFDLSKKHEFQYVPITNNTGSRHILRSWYRKNMGFSNGILAWLAHVCWSCPWLQSELKAGWWYTHPSEKYEFVSWDDCSQYMEKKMFQTTNQKVISTSKFSKCWPTGLSFSYRRCLPILPTVNGGETSQI